MTAKTQPASLPNLPNSASKQDEIDHLNAFCATLGKDTYLSSFLTVETREWVERQIRDDSYTNLWGEITSAQKRAAEARAVADEERAVNDTLRARIDMLEKTSRQAAERAGEVYQEQAKRIIALNELVDNQSDALAAANYNNEKLIERLTTVRRIAADAWLTDQKIDAADLRDAIK